MESDLCAQAKRKLSRRFDESLLLEVEAIKVVNEWAISRESYTLDLYFFIQDEDVWIETCKFRRL